MNSSDSGVNGIQTTTKLTAKWTNSKINYMWFTINTATPFTITLYRDDADKRGEVVTSLALIKKVATSETDISAATELTIGLSFGSKAFLKMVIRGSEFHVSSHTTGEEPLTPRPSSFEFNAAIPPVTLTPLLRGNKTESFATYTSGALTAHGITYTGGEKSTRELQKKKKSF